MKKLILALSLCAVSSASMAATANMCTGTAGNGTAPANTGTGYFVQTTFIPKCSANTQVHFQQSTSAAAVGSTSTKGNQVFQGHTNGGSVEKSAVACSTGGCTSDNAISASDAALTASSS